jgi:hypothetical protein
MAQCDAAGVNGGNRLPSQGIPQLRVVWNWNPCVS